MKEEFESAVYKCLLYSLPSNMEAVFSVCDSRMCHAMRKRDSLQFYHPPLLQYWWPCMNLEEMAFLQK
jgi:hypothetical protein